MVERFNRTLHRTCLHAIAVGKHPADWEVYIRKLCFAYNTSVHSSTGYTPFFLMFGRQATIPIDLMYIALVHVCKKHALAHWHLIQKTNTTMYVHATQLQPFQLLAYSVFLRNLKKKTLLCVDCKDHFHCSKYRCPVNW